MESLYEIKNLESLFTKHLSKNIKVLKQQSQLLTAPGENYGSTMASLDVMIEDENKDKRELHLVAKLIPKNELLRELFQVQITFIKELRVYTKIVPALSQLENEFGIVENRASDLFAKCYGGRSNLLAEEGVVDHNSVLLLENLKMSQFEGGDRLIGFDFESAEFILKNLARFHAVPIALKILKPYLFKTAVEDTLKVPFESGPISKENGIKFVNGYIDILNMNEIYQEQVDKLKNDLLKKVSTSMYSSSKKNNHFVTFCHFDFWVNNVMIKRDKYGKPIQLKIFDFQTSHDKTLVSDLLFFIYSSVSPTFLYERIDELIRIYYDSFITCLKSFNINLDNYSWDNFMQEIKSNAGDTLSQILIMYKPILMERGQINNVDDIKEEQFLDLNAINDKTKQRMVKTFIQFVEKGWI